MQREKGVLSKPCESCGSSLVAQTNPDGSTAYASCSKCFPAKGAKPAPKPEAPKSTPPVVQTASQKPERVTGTVVIEEHE